MSEVAAAAAVAAPLPLPRVVSEDEAKRLVEGVLATLAALERLIVEETRLVQDGRLADALVHETRKTELAGSYIRELEAVKTNAIALARFAPDALTALKETHQRFAEIIERNQAVLATARAVSEGLIRTLADEVGAAAQPAAYAPAGAGQPARRPRAVPLTLSKSL
ncbi:hypothetical protein QNA08_09460 [Chelatococcus sp. SYSU_G07232]|uniref:Flagellar protein FlgN n=1 Tax=Chelatococcus albus TaxID=3047466 RepID=A0ABT7AGG2_9HYPH|nr:hypothetical protein [Chelatococcus sp. SYSU_G07232]MDJ1158460.1 hypothetical protein [Chelatococcus sp. SYSU_G07232]